MRISATVLIALIGVVAVRAAIHTETVEYKQGDAALEGWLVYDESSALPDADETMRRLTEELIEEKTYYAKGLASMEQLKSLEKKQLGESLPGIAQDSKLSTLQEELNMAEQRLTLMKQRFTAAHPQVKEAAALVSDLEQKVNDRVDGIMLAMQQQLDTRKAGIAALESKIKQPNPQSLRPAILIVHQWMGLSDYEKKRAEMLAKLGYVVFAADIYGKGVRPKNAQEAGSQAGKYKNDRALLRARVSAGLDTLRKQKLVDQKHVAAIGYCFGGTAVIELARSGADIAGVVSFHGGLDSPLPADGRNIKCKVLVCHGADDPFEKPEDLVAFENEMRNAKVDWRLIKYGGAVHAFTDWNAGNDNSKGAAYNERADKRSWEDMKQFFAEIFK